MAELTQARLQELLHYDPDTGVFTRRVTVNANARAGARAGTPSSNGYRQIGIDGEIYYEHRLAWFYVNGRWPDGELDHDSLERADNSVVNLRPATRSQQSANQPRRSSAAGRFKGVCYHQTLKSRPWQARIRKDYRRISLGYFATEEEAAAAYDAGAVKLFGPFARLNFEGHATRGH